MPAKKKKSKPRLTRYSMAQLEEALQRKQRQEARKLEGKKRTLQAEIGKLDKQIAALTGKPARVTRRRKKAPARPAKPGRKRVTAAQAKNLQNRILKAVPAKPRGIAIGKLAKAVKASVPQVRRQLGKLVAARAVTKKGQRAATRYSRG